MVTTDQIIRFHNIVKRFNALKHEETWGMRPTLTDAEKAFLDTLMKEVWLSTILDHIAASTFEAADSCDGEGADALAQQAATVTAAALFCKTWGQP
jgi:hypothetical protein